MLPATPKANTYNKMMAQQRGISQISKQKTRIPVGTVQPRFTPQLSNPLYNIRKKLIQGGIR